MTSRISTAHRTAAIAALACLLAGGRAVVGRGAENQPDAARLDRLEARLDAAEAIRAVKRLQQTLGFYQEAGLWDEAAALFGEQVVGEFPDGQVTGRDAMRARLMRDAGRTAQGLAAGQLNAHFLLQPIVTVQPDGATVKAAWHEVAMLGTFGGSASWQGGIYENDYVRENGVWKIGRVRFFQQYSGSYDEFGHKSPPKWNVPYHFEAAHVGVSIPNGVGLRQGQRSASPAQRLAGAAARVRRMQDETAVHNLQHSYGYYLDRKLWDDVADLFSDDGSLQIEPWGTYVGRERIRKALEVMYGKAPLRPGELFDHPQPSTVVTVSPDGLTAHARTSELAMLGVNGEAARWETGTYENDFENRDGRWRLTAVRFYPRMTADYDQGWARDARPVPAPSQELPPDRLPDAAARKEPNVRYVAFHYPNPATGRAVRFPAGLAVASASGRNAVSSRATSPRSGKSASVATADVAAVERELEAAIAVDAVENLSSSYGYYIDESAWDNMADTFATTGSKEITGAGVYVGRERIRTILNVRGPRGGRTPTFFTIHQLTQPVIHIAPDGTSAKARLRLLQSGGNADGSSGSWIGGIYENTAVFEGGEWKFGVQDLHHTFNASYRNGWARMGAAARAAAPPTRPATARDVSGGGIQQGLGGASSPARFVTDYPPDRKIRSRQYAFPEIDEPAFHYRNPVSGRAPADLLP